MDFFLPDGATTVTVQHASYGTDASSSWELWAQSEACNCDKWTKVGTTVFTTCSALQAAAFTVNIPGSVKFEIRKTSGGAARLNIDDLVVTEFGVVQPSIDNDNMALGNPSGATTDTSYPHQLPADQAAVRPELPPRPGQAQLGELAPGRFATAAARRRAGRLPVPIHTLPAGWYQVQASSYTGSGFDRGHMCPSADRTSSPTTRPRF